MASAWGTCGLLKGVKIRSRMACNGVFVLGEVIVKDYKDEIVVILHNSSTDGWVIDANKKICQLMLVPSQMVARENFITCNSNGRRKTWKDLIL